MWQIYLQTYNVTQNSFDTQDSWIHLWPTVYSPEILEENKETDHFSLALYCI